MNPPLIIDGHRCEDEQAVRDYCFNYTKPNGFQQDIRLARHAYSAPYIQLIEILEATGHTVEQAGI